jgi:hypothetical protein
MMIGSFVMVTGRYLMLSILQPALTSRWSAVLFRVRIQVPVFVASSMMFITLAYAGDQGLAEVMNLYGHGKYLRAFELLSQRSIDRKSVV